MPAAQRRPKPSPATLASSAAAKVDAAVHYRIEAADVSAHLFRVTLTIAEPQAQQTVSLPVWIPGSYLVREFARHLQGLQAQQGRQTPELRQLDKCTWQIEARPGKSLVLSYQVYAFDNSVRACWLDAHRGFFNGTGLCLRVHGQEDAPHALQLVNPSGAQQAWSAATALHPVQVDAKGFGLYRADDYDTLADSPVELGDFWSGEFTAGGVPHRFVVAGAARASFDGAKLIADTQRICEAQMRFWHPDGAAPPHDRYVFMLNAVDDGYGGLEHRHSTALICARRDLPRQGETRSPEGYTTLLGLISHEYFHTWNVKRLRPAELARYDYTQENYTRLLWFFEGFTSYYDDILLRRAGLLDDAGYLRLLNKTINQVAQAPGQRVQSVAQSSFDAWVKYYRQDENTANATISYYTKGALVALCFDLTLRREGKGSLDDAMRTLWKRCAAGPMTEEDFAIVLAEQAGRAFTAEFAAWVHGTADLPLADLLGAHGVDIAADPSQPAQRLGMRVAENGGSVQVKVVLRGGAVERAGMAAGDEWLGLETADGEAWRIGKLDDLAMYLGAQRRATALVARDKRLMKLALELPETDTTARLVIKDAGKVTAWLAEPAKPVASKAKRHK
ncbi:peptidase M61 [Xylophilus sp. GOD-11R]|uniref:M61 family metallopeptidase n=1 Tax=Xylophilus sp. GOD-11R TaxID=3089814 RepID=UPI00298CE274|nr:peptidase M61 [Xylophilus sp. GOD-11R]WPB57383.1 peptidase M61 [Xylophilus sp. GOD-11R]